MGCMLRVLCLLLRVVPLEPVVRVVPVVAAVVRCGIAIVVLFAFYQ